jgi:hypothetical protein
MSKSSQEDESSCEFWKKMRMGATAAVALGTGMYAVTSAIKRQGVVSTIIGDVKTALHSVPQLTTEATNVSRAPTQPTDIEEARAVLQVQMRHAMERQDACRVQELARQLDQLDSGQVQGYTPLPMQRAASMMPSSMEQVPSPMGGPTGAQMPSMMQMPTRMQMQMPINMQADMLLPTSPHMPTHNRDDGHTGTLMSTGMAAPIQGNVLEGLSVNTTGMQAPLSMSTADGVPARGCVSTSPTHTHTSVKGPAGTAEATKPSHRKVSKAVEPSLRQMAALQLQAGDFVEALDPFHGGWSAGTIHLVTKSGLVHVRWSDPGTDAHGNPFHPIGEVYAEQIRVKRRKPSPSTLIAAPQAEKDEASPVDLPDGLQLGDICYAEGTVVEKKWFQVMLLGVRARPPAVRVEYLTTLDGQTNELLLPSPHKDYVAIEMIRRNRPPEPVEASLVRRSLRDESTEDQAPGTSQDSGGAQSQEDQDDVVITPDLMCSVCERPDNEAQMLVCDCKAGYHIYCLTPPLADVPEGEWHCPACAKKA